MDMSATIIIAQPIEKVVAYVSNVRNDVNWRTGVTEAGLQTGNDIEMGTIGYARQGKVEAVWKVTNYQANSRIDWELISGPFTGTGGYRFVPVAGGTQFTLVADIVPSGLYRLMGPIFAWIGRRQNQTDVECLRQILESS